MTRIIALANQKGGVGKTTTCINLAAALAKASQRVLLVDLDPQGNATVGSGVSKNTLSNTMNDVLLETVGLTSIILKTTAQFDIAPTNGDLTEAEVSLVQIPSREHRLHNALNTVTESYDYILIDCPPSLNMLTVNALVAANSVIVPMQCEYYALEGLTGLLNTIEEISKTVNPQLHLEGIVRTMVDARTSLANQVSEQLIAHFGKRVYETVIPRNVRLAEAPSHGLPGVIYDKTASGSIAYLALAKEMMASHPKE